MTNILKYTGVSRDGTSSTGAVEAHDTTPAWLAQQLYDRGFQRVTIKRGTQQVGGVGRIDGKRDWWGECTT